MQNYQYLIANNKKFIHFKDVKKWKIKAII